jgi:outer membrane protein TolC
MLLAGLPVLVGAQEKKRTLEECMRYAVENSTRTAKLKAQNEIYAADRQEAIAGFFPSLNMETGLSMSFGRSLDPETNGYINTTTWRNNYEVYSSMPLFNGFSRVFKAKSAKINRLKGLDELQDANDMIAYETMELFFNVQYYMGTVRLAEEQLDESVDNLKRFERMEELGLKSAPDVAEIRAKEAEDRYSLTRQKNLYKLELIKLKEKMNFPIDAELEITNVDAGLLIDTSKENVLDVYRKMLQISPQVAAAGKALEISRLNLKMAKGNALPRILLNGSYSTGFSRLMDGSEYMHFKDQLKNRQGTAVGISLSIPILNGLTRASEIKRSKSRLEIAENEHQELLRRVYSEIEQTVADVNGLSDEYLHAKQRTDAMKAAHQVNTRKYEEGLIDAMELSTSANRLLQSQIEELYTNLKYQLKHRLLEYYKGNAPLYLP